MRQFDNPEPQPVSPIGLAQRSQCPLSSGASWRSLRRRLARSGSCRLTITPSSGGAWSCCSSLDAIPTILEASLGTRIVVLTMQNEPAFARQALGAGAMAYVLKEAADDELVEAVRGAAAGETCLNPQLGARMAAEPLAPSGPPDDLSEREVEVLRTIALGHTNAEIAEQLYLSVRTVESHRAHIQQKL